MHKSCLLMSEWWRGKNEQTDTNDVTDIYLLSIIRRQKVHRCSYHCRHLHLNRGGSLSLSPSLALLKCLSCSFLSSLHSMADLCYIAVLAHTHVCALHLITGNFHSISPIHIAQCTQCDFSLDNETHAKEKINASETIFCAYKHIHRVFSFN